MEVGAGSKEGGDRRIKVGGAGWETLHRHRCTLGQRGLDFIVHLTREGGKVLLFIGSSDQWQLRIVLEGIQKASPFHKGIVP